MLPSIFGCCCWKKRGVRYAPDFAIRKFPSTNTTGQLHGSTCVNTTLIAQAISRQFCSWRSSAGRKGGTSRKKGFPGLATRKGRPRTRKITNYQAGGGFRPYARGDNGIQPGAKGCELVDRDGTASPMPLSTRLHFEPCYVLWTRKPWIWAERVS